MVSCRAVSQSVTCSDRMGNAALIRRNSAYAKLADAATVCTSTPSKPRDRITKLSIDLRRLIGSFLCIFDHFHSFRLVCTAFRNASSDTPAYPSYARVGFHSYTYASDGPIKELCMLMRAGVRLRGLLLMLLPRNELNEQLRTWLRSLSLTSLEMVVATHLQETDILKAVDLANLTVFHGRRCNWSLCPKLERLSVTLETELTKSDVEALAKLPNLRSISAAFSAYAIKAIAGLKKLCALELLPVVDEEGLKEEQYDFTFLPSLPLTSFRYNGHGHGNFMGPLSRCDLQELALTDCGLKVDCLPFLAKTFPHLRSLTLDLGFSAGLL